MQARSDRIRRIIPNGPRSKRVWLRSNFHRPKKTEQLISVFNPWPPTPAVKPARGGGARRTRPGAPPWCTISPTTQANTMKRRMRTRAWVTHLDWGCVVTGRRWERIWPQQCDSGEQSPRFWSPCAPGFTSTLSRIPAPSLGSAHGANRRPAEGARVAALSHQALAMVPTASRTAQTLTGTAVHPVLFYPRDRARRRENRRRWLSRGRVVQALKSRCSRRSYEECGSGRSTGAPPNTRGPRDREVRRAKRPRAASVNGPASQPVGGSRRLPGGTAVSAPRVSHMRVGRACVRGKKESGPNRVP
jgi:hypothetical protein